MLQELTSQEILEMSYPDFVGFIGQKNTPPGGYFTIQRTIQLSAINASSHLMDLACSTGFSSRETIKITGCSAKGIDISGNSILTAKEEAFHEGLQDKAVYVVGDATELPFQDDEFTHILGGCKFAFIQNRDKALQECYRVLANHGQLCIANFYYKASPPESLLDQVNAMIGFRPQAHWDRAWWMSFFGQYFQLVIEEIHPLPVISEKQLSSEIQTLIFDRSPKLQNMNEELKQTCSDRLIEIRKVLNEHRRYQDFNITIWKLK